MHKLVFAAVALLSAITIPGYGPEGTLSDVRKISKALDELRDTVWAQVAQGKTLEQLRQMNLLEPWKDLLLTPGPDYLKSCFDCLTRPPDPKFQL